MTATGHIRTAALAALAALSLAGCAPAVVWRVETEIDPAFGVRRSVAVRATANPAFPAQRPRLADHFVLPPPEEYEKFAYDQDQASFSGYFGAFEEILPDIVRVGPGIDRHGRNSFFRRSVDLVLLEIIDVEERIDDVAGRADGEMAWRDLQRLATTLAMAVARALYADAYDLAPLDAWLQGDVARAADALYGDLWEVRRARRGGVAGLPEEVEFLERAWEQVGRLGLDAESRPPVTTAEAWERLRPGLAAKLAALARPRAAGGSALSLDNTSGKAWRDGALAAFHAEVTQRHGGLASLQARVETLATRAFGAYLPQASGVLASYPAVVFQFRWRLPGAVLRTNGLRDLDGSIQWTITGRDMALAGQNLWAQTLVVREDATRRLGLADFPGSVEAANRLYREYLTPEGQVRERVVAAMRAAVETGTLAALEALAAAADPNAPHADEAAAARLLRFLRQYRP